MKKLYSVDDCDTISLEEIKDLYRRHVSPSLERILDSFSSGDEVVDRAEGVWLTTRSGRKLLDVTGGTGVLSLGHNPDAVLSRRIQFQERKRMEVHKTFFSPYLAILSHNLASVLPGDLDYSYFCNSGAEAVEGALKLAYKYHQGSRNLVLHADISFHGKLLGAGSVTGDSGSDFRFPVILNRDQFIYGDILSIKRKLDETRGPSGKCSVYAIIVEPFSVNHLRWLESDFLRELRELCDREDVILIFDEVHSGWCKTGPLFAFMESGVVPDVVALSKALGGGKATISAYVSRGSVLHKAYGALNEALLHSTTYSGFAEECVTAIESINTLVRDDCATRSHEIGKLAHEQFEALRKRHPDQVREMRGRGAVHGIFLSTDGLQLREFLSKLPLPLLKDKGFIPKLLVAAVTDRMFTHHDIYCLFMNTREPAVMFSPSFVISDDDIRRFFSSLDRVLDEGVWTLAYHFAKRKFGKFFKR
ncbi:MAG: hypothetical protein A2X94_07960 [Bdellovibrionales bacterium GWB1_55_8]|nr:MAG: hypothetical protein A2X94_07960 [Bdellovibrionales bacterium GWB1_55_8]